MKLLLFVLGLTLCTALPSFRHLAETSDSDLVLDYTGQDLDFGSDDFGGPYNIPRGLFGDLVGGEEEALLGENTEEVFEDPVLAEIRDDAFLNDVFNFGVQNVINTGIGKNKIPNTTFEVANVSSWNKTSNKNGERYNFVDSVAVSENGASVLTMNFTVYNDLKTQQKTVRAYSYRISTTAPRPTPADEAYTTLTPEQVDAKPEIKECLTYAIQESVKQPETYNVTKTNSVQTQTSRGTVYYKYDVELSNGKNKNVHLLATVSYRPGTGVKEVVSYQTKTTTTTPRK